MSIEIKIDLARINAKPPLRALADVTLTFSEGEVTLRRCAIFQKDGQPPWANLPSFPIEKNGKRAYAVFIDLPHELKKKVTSALLEEYARKVDLFPPQVPLASRATSAGSVGGPDNPRQRTAGDARGPHLPGLDVEVPLRAECWEGRRRRPT
jgi:hypothetical protein